MSTERAIVGIGELMLATTPEGSQPAGSVAALTLNAARLGRRAVAVSRVGQDHAGDEVLAHLKARGVEIDHVQRDPDLDTARLTVRRLAGREMRTLDPRAAFDNLQWDYDLEDLAQQTDAVVTTWLARRHGQASTTIDRFVTLCRHGLKVLDLVVRDDGQPVDRAAVMRCFERTDALVVDAKALASLAPGAGEPIEPALSSMCRRHGLAFVLHAQGERWTTATETEVHRGSEPVDPSQHVEGVTALLHALLSGWDWPRSLALAARYARLAREHPEGAVPRDLFA